MSHPIVYTYCRISSERQDSLGQQVQLDKWEREQRGKCTRVVDIGSTKTMKQWLPGFQRIYDDIEAGRVAKVVVCMVSRFGRKSSETHKFFEMARSKGVPITFLREGCTTGSIGGDLVAKIFADLAQADNEMKGEARRTAGSSLPH